MIRVATGVIVAAAVIAALYSAGMLRGYLVGVAICESRSMVSL